MTIALIGKEDSVRASARVGLVSSGSSEALAEAVAQAGHEATVFSSWDQLAEARANGPLDVVFCHEALAGDVPATVDAPILAIGASTLSLIHI